MIQTRQTRAEILNVFTARSVSGSEDVSDKNEAEGIGYQNEKRRKDIRVQPIALIKKMMQAFPMR
jgi:hypothetical protein